MDIFYQNDRRANIIELVSYNCHRTAADIALVYIARLLSRLDTVTATSVECVAGNKGGVNIFFKRDGVVEKNAKRIVTNENIAAGMYTHAIIHICNRRSIRKVASAVIWISGLAS